MNVLIDYSQIPIQKVGVGVYAYNLIKQVSVLDNTNKYFVLIQDDDDTLELFSNEFIHLIKVNHKIFRHFFLRFLLEQLYIPYLVIRKKISKVHSLHYSFPLLRFNAKRVVTIHDLTFFLMPEVHLRFKRLYFRTFIKLARFLDCEIICVSHSTKRDLIKITKVSSERCTIIPLGKSDIFHNRYSINEIRITKKKYKIEENYFLFIGTIEPRKNIITLIKAFYEFNKLFTNYSLVIVGKKGWYYEEIFKLIDQLCIREKIIFTGFVFEEEKPLLLNGSQAFIYPSLYEGFGIPILEAMACGTPVITANLSSMPEVAGDAGILINPENSNELFKAMVQVIGNPSVAENMKNAGLIQSDKFSWEKTAKQTITLYCSK